MSRTAPRRALAVLGLAVGFALLPATAASAHPLGNFTRNTADRLVVTADGVTVQHVLDLAEFPTVELLSAASGVDTNRDQALSPAELTAYGARECAATGEQLVLTVDGAPAPLTLASSSGASRPGVAGLTTTRVECAFSSGVRPARDVRFQDPAAADRNGWREVTAASDCGPLRDSDVPGTSPSGLLARYPTELLKSPVDVTSASFSVQGGAACTAGGAGSGARTTDEVAPRGLDRVSRFFTDFLNPKSLSAPFAVVAVLASVLFGALHAVAPGHGKTVMAAYLVGQRGTRRQALQLGAFVTFSHTASVLALGAALSLGSFLKPELVVPATEVLSGVLLAAVGAYLVVLAVRRLRGTADHSHAEHGHDHPHGDHGHGDHAHDHPHGDHAHGEAAHDRSPVPVAVGAVGAAVTAGAVGAAGRAEPARTATASPLEHSHGGRAHTHAPLPEGRIGFKTLAAVGVAGGLVPSPSALLVLLGATALGRAWFGVVLVVAYGLGMAVTLTVAGLLLLRARAVLDRKGWTAGRAARWVRLLPLVAGAVVVLLGLVLVLRGVGTAGPLL